MQTVESLNEIMENIISLEIQGRIFVLLLVANNFLWAFRRALGFSWVQKEDDIKENSVWILMDT